MTKGGSQQVGRGRRGGKRVLILGFLGFYSFLSSPPPPLLPSFILSALSVKKDLFFHFQNLMDSRLTHLSSLSLSSIPSSTPQTQAGGGLQLTFGGGEAEGGGGGGGRGRGGGGGGGGGVQMPQQIPHQQIQLRDLLGKGFHFFFFFFFLPLPLFLTFLLSLFS